MTEIIEAKTEAGEDETPPAPYALHGLAHVVQASRRPPGQWTLTAFTHKSWDIRMVHALQCVPQREEAETWVVDALQTVTRCPVQQFAVITNLAPGITVGYALEANGQAWETGLMFGNHVVLEQLNGPEDVMTSLVTNAKALWGQAWEPDTVRVILGEEGE